MKQRNQAHRRPGRWRCTALLAAALLIVLTLALPVAAEAAVKEGQTFISLGEDLSDTERAQVLQLFGITEEELAGYQVISVTNADEHAVYDSYLPQEVIGTRSISSAMITTREAGHGIQVRTENITWCTISMYQNALATAGIQDADVVIVSPGAASGSAALLGVTKAYSELTGESLKAESIDAAAQELILTGDIGEAIDDPEKAAQLIATVKEAVASGSLDADEVQNVIEEAAGQLDIDISDVNKEDITELMEKIDDLDLDSESLREQAGAVYDKLREKGIDVGISKETALNWFQKLLRWLREIWNSLRGK